MSVVIKLNRVSPVPLYHQLADQLKQAVAQGDLPKGSMLESELVLAEDWNVSRPTVRRAIQQLVDDGLLVRRRGIGTQIVNDKVRRGFALTSLYDDLVDSGSVPFTRVLTFETIQPPASIAQDLGLDEGDRVVHLVRLRGAGGVAFALMSNWVRLEVADGLTIAELESTGLYRLIRDRGVRPHSAMQRLGATLATQEISDVLDVPVGAAMVTMRRVMQDDSGTPIEVGDHYYDADNYSVEVSVVES